MKATNLGQADRTVTRKFHPEYNPEISRRIWEQCRDQDSAANLAIAELIEKPTTALRKNTKAGETGLYGLWLEWRETAPWMGDILQAVWRPGVNKAKARVDAHEKSNGRRAKLILDGHKKAQKPKKRTKKGRKAKEPSPGKYGWINDLPRKAQKGQRDPVSLFYMRKMRERLNNHTLTIFEGIRRIDDRSFRIPGIGDIRVKGRIPADFEPRSCTIVERSNNTPGLRNRTLQPEERTWRLHIQQRVPAPLRPETRAPSAPSAGIDQGVAKPITVTDDEGRTTIWKPDPGKTAALRTERERFKKRRKGCNHGSRRWTQLGADIRALGRRIRNIEREELRAFCRKIGERYAVVGIEKLNNTGMRASARGTQESAGRNVSQKQGLNEALARVAPGRQTEEMKAECVRRGAVYVFVNPKYTSTTCARCSCIDKKKRESQAVFRCTRCGFSTDADANAAEIIRRRAWAEVQARRAGVDRSEARGGRGPSPRTPE